MDLNIYKHFCTSHFEQESETSICHPSLYTYILRYCKSSQWNAMTLHWKTSNPSVFSNFLSHQCHLTRLSWQTVLRHAHKSWFTFQPDDRMAPCSTRLIEMRGLYGLVELKLTDFPCVGISAEWQSLQCLSATISLTWMLLLLTFRVM